MPRKNNERRGKRTSQPKARKRKARRMTRPKVKGKKQGKVAAKRSVGLSNTARLEDAIAPSKVVTPRAALLAAAAVGEKVLPGDKIVQIFSDCISHVTGNTSKIDLSSTLQKYGFDTQHQVDTFSTYVIGSSDFGVPHYGFSLPADALNWVTNTAQLGNLLKFIQDNAT
jgi:hypothetical protein